MSVEQIDLMAGQSDIEYPSKMVETDRDLCILYPPNNPDAVKFAVDGLTYLQDLWESPVYVMPTEPTIEANTEVMKEMQAKHPVHFIVPGGDGTHSMILSSMSRLEQPAVGSLMRFGNACDIARMTHNSLYGQDPIGAFREGVVKPIIPIDIQITDENDDTYEHLAWAYGGIGLTGIMGALFNTAEYREKLSDNKLLRFIHEAGSTRKNLLAMEPIRVDDGCGEKELLEFSLNNGNREAKLCLGDAGRIHRPEAYIGRVENGKNRLKSLGKAAVTMMLGQNKLTPGEELVVRAESKADILFQRDGEHQNLGRSATLRYKIAGPDQAVRVVSTKGL
jgi:hypothetical protein